jgi:hypothetical protein
MAKKNGKASKNPATATTSSARVQVPKPTPRPRPIKSAGTITLPPSLNDNATSNRDSSDNDPDSLSIQPANIPPQLTATNSQTTSTRTTAATPIPNENSPPINPADKDPEPHSTQSANAPLQSVATNATTSRSSTALKKSATSASAAQIANDANLAAQLATALGEPSAFIEYHATDFGIAEVDRLKKREAVAAAKIGNTEEIKRPKGAIHNLQEAMGLEDDKALYLNCRVSPSVVMFLLSFNSYYRQLSKMSWHMRGCRLMWIGEGKTWGSFQKLSLL